jgi:flagellar biosynthesis protein FliR
MYPLLRPYLPVIPEEIGGMLLLVIRETLIGWLIGFAFYVTFEAIALGFQFVGTQMGFGAAGVFDPGQHSQTSVLVPLKTWCVLMVFFMMDMHHQIIQLFLMSYDLTKHLGTEPLTMGFVQTLIKVTGKLFVLGVQIAAPFTLLVLVCNTGLSMLGRMLPQMNVLIFSFPITFLLGFVALYILAPEVFEYFEKVLGEAGEDVLLLLRAI